MKAELASLAGSAELGFRLWLADPRSLFSAPCISHEWKENHIANRLRPRQQHYQSVDADAFAAGRWQPVRKRAHVILIHLMRFVVARGALCELVVESFLLFDWIVQLAEGVAQFESSGEDFETLDVIRVVGFLLRQRRDFRRVVVDDGWLDDERRILSATRVL